MPSFLPLGLGSALTRLGTRVRRVMLSGVLLVPVAILAGPMERLIAAAACTTPGGSLMLTSAVRYVRALSAKADGVAPAAQGTQEGPWSVAGTADEMKHVVSVPSRDAEGKFLANAAEPIARVAATSIQTIPRGGERQQALTQRLLPGIPPELQIAYGLLVMLGLLGVPASRLWWRRLWPPEHAGDYAGHIGYWAARTLRGAVFALVFLPLTALVSA
ncbi:MAG: hypothetical protein J2P50_15430, partial [Hyphomicrobiaceae bacterium]|nr:hypothetical protein [Hyphomicrobiaceae bacterium]